MNNDINYRTDYNKTPIKRTVRWQDIPIGIQHEEGDRRFSMAPPLYGASYGCVVGTYGMGEDGKSIDVYLGRNLESDRVYRISQIDDYGNPDEFKWLVGFSNIDEAENVYRRNVPWRYFGGIEESSLSEFKKICQKDKNSFSKGGSSKTGKGNLTVVDSDITISNHTNTDPTTEAYHRGLFDLNRYDLDTSTKIQSILFEKSKWTLSQAVQWAKKHKFNIIKADPESEDAQYIHVRVLNPKACKGKQRTIEFSKAKGIIARICVF